MELEHKTWEELTVVEQLQNEYSDFYKEVHGFRPRAHSSEQWNCEYWLRSELAALEERSVSVFAEEAEREARAIEKLEAGIVKLIEVGAKDRETAISWLMTSLGVTDFDHLSYEMGVPYGYFTKETA